MSEPKDSDSSEQSDKEHTAVGELMLRAFGPLADALGYELAKMPPFAHRNLVRLAEAVRRKNGSRGDSEPSARLLKQIVDDVAWTEDEIITQYLAGVIAASSYGLAKERGVVIAAAIRRLSAVQLRAHYVMYSLFLAESPSRRSIDLRWSSNGSHSISALGVSLLRPRCSIEELNSR